MASDDDDNGTLHGHAPEGSAGVVETHSGVVFFLGDRAYKVKKPVSFDFLDFRRLETRRHICEREVELNSRLAPDVYLGVADVVGPGGSPCEHLVVMRRLPGERRLSALLEGGAPVETILRDIAGLLAAFHDRAGRSSDIEACATASAMLGRWEACGREMSSSQGIFDPDSLERVDRLARRYLDGRGPLFGARASAGRVCDGHGDLLCDDIFCLGDGPRILDCLEFDDRLRYVDVLGDIASLAMDIERLGHPDLAAAFLQQYRSISADEWPETLAHHYIAYRALVRAMVAGLRCVQGDLDARGAALRLVAMSVRHLEQSRVRLVVIGGLPGTGKSTLARHVAAAIHATMIRSDEVRKTLAGVNPATHAAAEVGKGIYAASATRATYDAMIDAARSRLALGESVVLDATFTDPRWRAAASDLAEEVAADIDEFRCVAPMSVIESRIARRVAQLEVSDATVEVARHMAGSQVRWPTAIDVDTARGVADALSDVLKRMGVAAP